MPTRLIREGIITSQRVNALDDSAEVFYRRLMSIVDDFGRCEAWPALLRGKLYMMRLSRMPETRVEKVLAQLVEARLIICYQADSKPYLEIVDFRQQTRGKSKCPPPPAVVHGKKAGDVPPLTDANGKLADATALKTPVHLGVCVFGGVSEGGDGGAPGGAGVSVPASPDEASPTITPTEIYDAYPRKVNRPDALRAIEKAIKAGAPAAGLLERTRLYAAAVARWPDDFRFTREGRDIVPHPASWFNAEGFADDEATWQPRLRSEKIAGVARRGGAEPEFNPNTPNAHTGGLAAVGPVVNTSHLHAAAMSVPSPLDAALAPA